MSKCFSCQKGAPKTVIDMLLLHKKIYETTGKVYWFFRESETGQTKIANDKSFKVILPTIRENNGAEWRHIAEFGNVTNDNVSKHIEDEKPKTSKRKSKKRNAGESLEENI
jgi:hypothetical protein